VALRLRGIAGLGGVGEQFLGLRHRGAVRLDQRSGDVFRRALCHELLRQGAVLVVELRGC